MKLVETPTSRGSHNVKEGKISPKSLNAQHFPQHEQNNQPSREEIGFFFKCHNKKPTKKIIALNFA